MATTSRSSNVIPRRLRCRRRKPGPPGHDRVCRSTINLTTSSRVLGSCSRRTFRAWSAKLEDAGCTWVNPVEHLPPTLGDTSARPDDDRFRFITGRRPIVEWAFGRAAAEHDGVSVRRGVSIAALVTGDACR